MAGCSCSLQVLAWYWPPVLFVIFVGIAVGLYHTYLQPLGAPDITGGDYTQPFTLTSFALALLLVFRTNSSYDRHRPQLCHALCAGNTSSTLHAVCCAGITSSTLYATCRETGRHIK